MHMWGDKDFDDWEALDEAADFVSGFCALWARMGGDSKQKYGTVRYYCHFGLSLHSLIFPKYCYFKHKNFPNWLWRFDINYFQSFCQRTGLQRLWIKWQQKIYREAHKRAIEKWPKIREEILGAPDFAELLEGL